MSEAIISRRRKVNINYRYETIYNDIYNYIDQIIYDPPLTAFMTSSTTFTVPRNLDGNQVTVALYGAKGSDNELKTGQGGEVVVQDITVEPGEEIQVYVGSEGIDDSNGEPTTFGTYAIANGGLSAKNIDDSVSNISDINTNNNSGYAIVWYGTKDEEDTKQ